MTGEAHESGWRRVNAALGCVRSNLKNQNNIFKSSSVLKEGTWPQNAQGGGEGGKCAGLIILL